ncbi:hypothetical protein JQ582_39160 [Bradyrhizobium japonicum]|uniref:hypothetical protein n=1 Tax=Bradyrhizobium japonicum TaxID=375 RepID=UPI001BAA2EB8|nr:hypothetical protein [Bradyrhizobium japonicum]MBR0749947.1 hypothetical protein [Bradyrhizobium japonicum]
MQIIIPMSGFGERFRRAGYNLPKPLIEVEGKPIIAHVIDMYPGETDFLFICNQDHLDEPSYRMREVLEQHCPSGQIVGIPPHQEGPIGAVLKVRPLVKLDRPTVVNYCDFCCYWDYEDFKAFVSETGCAGAVPAYRGFHPHSLGSTFYAYMQHDDLWMQDIQEKQPFTDNPSTEFASSGTYYFASGELCLDLFQEVHDRPLRVAGEFYASMAYKVMQERDLPIAIYDLQHFMQWGTPQDLEEYCGWSNAFRRLAEPDGGRAEQAGSVLVPMAGYGKRFAELGYAEPKPLISVSGRPMAIQAIHDLPNAPALRCVLREDMPGLAHIERALRTSFEGVTKLVLNEGTNGQATTCSLGLAGLDPALPLTIGACDNAMLYDKAAFEAELAGEDADMLVWVIRGHADGRLRPHMFGWVDADEDGQVSGVRVKKAPDDPRTAPMIVGAFTFRKAGDFALAYQRLIDRQASVNGEYYVDSMIEDAVAIGLNVRLFEIDHYLGWGTPNDLKIFEYWQSCFHKWRTHPYRLEKDSRVNQGAVPALEAKYAPIVPQRPRPRRGG